jgi:hypothetical protein
MAKLGASLSKRDGGRSGVMDVPVGQHSPCDIDLIFHIIQYICFYFLKTDDYYSWYQ